MNECDFNLNRKKKKKLYCSNCGKYGHYYKRCHEPITSLGIIAIQINFDLIKKKYNNITKKKFERIFKKNGHGDNKIINIFQDNNKNYNILKYINYFKKDIKFLMVRRKNTLGYLEFLRGRYNTDDNEHIMSLFEQMTPYEIEKIKNNNFNDLWQDLWMNENRNKNYIIEKNNSNSKYNLIKENKMLDYFINNAISNFEIPEWGFPKGRRNYHEKNKECAKRELNEETGLKEEEYMIFDNVTPLNEIFKGTNGILYKHIYYIALYNENKDINLDEKNNYQMEEIGDIGWFNYEEAIKKIRPYQKERKKILNELYIFIIINLLKNNEKKINKTNKKKFKII
tara:strand:+ start:14 stop:1033 length:1020 start_codon:yes stop_codon:yes gene_type:complete